jgi:glycosyltransferase involved in cell wall biosynthesis
MERGGAEMRTLEVMRHVDRNEYQFHFCVLSGLPGSLDDEIRALGGEVHYCRLDWRFPAAFHQLLLDQKPDIVHSHVHLFSGYILRQAAKAHVPTRIAHFRSTQDDHGRSLRRSIQRRIMAHWIDRFATAILAVSEGAMRFSWGENWSSDSRCRVIYNGIDPAPFYEESDSKGVLEEFGLSPDSPLFIHVGRMHRSKNHPRLLTIFREIVKTCPTARLLLVGREDAEIKQHLTEAMQRPSLDSQIIFAGERTDVPRLLSAADCMIFPSVWEGLPGAVLEACAAGVSVIGSDIPSIVEISRHISSVRVCSLNETDGTWAKEALRLADERPGDGTRSARIDNFRQSIFNIDRCVDAFKEVWQHDR